MYCTKLDQGSMFQRSETANPNPAGTGPGHLDAMLLVHGPLDLVQEVLKAAHDLIVWGLRDAGRAHDERTTRNIRKPTALVPAPTVNPRNPKSGLLINAISITRAKRRCPL